MTKKQIVLQEQKEHISSLMDGIQCDATLVNKISNNDELMACWRRYHVVRDAINGSLHDSALTCDIVSNVAQMIALEPSFNLYNEDSIKIENSKIFKHGFWAKLKDSMFRFGQIGLTAGVTLAIIAGVQYQQNNVDESIPPVLNTVPVGVSVSPVGGLVNKNSVKDKEALQEQEYNKIRLLTQDYELQKRLNVQ